MFPPRLMSGSWSAKLLVLLTFFWMTRNFLLVVAAMIIPTAESLNRRNSTHPYPILIVVSLDGFKPDYLSEANTPHLMRLARDGVDGGKQMRSMFITKTYPNHFSIATGLSEESHGIVNNQMWDPVLKDEFSGYSSLPKWWDAAKPTPIWIDNQECNTRSNPESDHKFSPRKSASMMWPGSDSSFAGKYVSYLHAYENETSWSKRIDEVIEWVAYKSQPANLVLIYFDEPDSTAHYYGPSSREVADKVHQLDTAIGYLITSLKNANIFNETNLIILSDHGMAEINDSRLILLSDFFPGPYVEKGFDLYGASPTWSLWPNQKGDVQKIYATLKKASLPRHFKVYLKNEIPARYYYQNNRRIGPIFLVADDGYDLMWEKEDWIRSKVWGNHGYDNEALSMRPLFIAHGPAFKSRHKLQNAFYNVDLYPLMHSILDCDPAQLAPNNGSFLRVADMLQPIYRDYYKLPARRVLLDSNPSTTTSSDAVGRVFRLFSILLLGFLCLCGSAVCFVTCAGYSKQGADRRYAKAKLMSDAESWDAYTSPGLDLDLKGQLNGVEMTNLLRNRVRRAEADAEAAQLLLINDTIDQQYMSDTADR